jgi:hypothetical protein
MPNPDAESGGFMPNPDAESGCRIRMPNPDAESVLTWRDGSEFPWRSISSHMADAGMSPRGRAGWGDRPGGGLAVDGSRPGP